MAEETFIDLDTQVVMTAEQLMIIKDNPAGLTLEGAEMELKNWLRSNNRYMKEMYNAMIKKCKTFSQSGKTLDGYPILRRNEAGEPQWIDKSKKEGELSG